ncbi:MAG TPA: FtsX-like permease family protein [Gemmataceae bacterium]|jgi:lipoprotein-releasing system permease protein|nr:FtsX-like permease family protein [Gemmataceae bacterium]
MYKLLLCWRYLCSRYLAFICIISVTLGVGTLITVNSVMNGFSTKLKDRLHGLLSDIVVESMDPIDGFPITTDEMMKRIQESPAGPHIHAMSPTVEIFAIMQFRFNEKNITRRVVLVGVDPKYQKDVGGFTDYIVDPERRKNPSFKIAEDALHWYNVTHPPIPDDPLPMPPTKPVSKNPADEPPALTPLNPNWKETPKDVPPPDQPPSLPYQPHGIIVGHAIAFYRYDPPNGGPAKDVCLLDPGAEVMIYTVGTPNERGEVMPVSGHFLVCDYAKSEMSEYDSTYVYVPLDYLQHLRTMDGRVNSLQIRLKDYKSAPIVKAELQKLFPSHTYHVATWEDKQGALLSAISIERGILNVLLFMIIGVAGFGILAIFSMIVTEKTRDIGILKSLGASHRGVMSIFLWYGLLLGVVGSAIGTIGGLVFTKYINEIEEFISRLTGHEVFSKSVYYFDKIPTDVQPGNIFWINVGAIFIAVFFSILPAWRAARLQPVSALRYE